MDHGDIMGNRQSHRKIPKYCPSILEAGGGKIYRYMHSFFKFIFWTQKFFQKKEKTLERILNIFFDSNNAIYANFLTHFVGTDSALKVKKKKLRREK